MISDSASDSEATLGSDAGAFQEKQKKQAKEKQRCDSSSKKLSKHSIKEHKMSDSEEESDTEGKKSKEIIIHRKPCTYGDKCYRKNREHLKSFSHPNRSNEEITPVKRIKIDPYIDQSLIHTNPFGFFVTRVTGISKDYNNHIAWGIKDLLNPIEGTLKESAQFNYLIDVPWLMQQYPEEYRNQPLTIVHGEQRDSKKALEKSAAHYPNVKFCQGKLDIPYGTHHTKMMFLHLVEGLQIIIHTSNLVDSDWLQRTQGMWRSPIFPPLKGEPSLTEGESVTGFKADIIEYMSTYGAGLDEWCKIIKKHDLSTAKVFIIGSVPGRHIGSKKTCFGHLKLRKVLSSNGPIADTVTREWPVVGQFSSIGSLGASPDLWLRGEWLASLATVKGQSVVTKQPPLKLVFPTVENVRKSLEGYPAGTSLPYSIKVAKNQPYLKDFLHEWKSERIGRSRASPHIKTYMRLSPSSKKVAWFLVTSANLSKAAWGALEKKDTQLMIRSYELGVLFLPKHFLGEELFNAPPRATVKDPVPIPVPYDLPLSKYGEKDEPWIWDIPHVYAPDCNGNKWCPP